MKRVNIPILDFGLEDEEDFMQGKSNIFKNPVKIRKC